MKLVNQDCDFHMHTLNFSDGMNTPDEIVQYAGKIGLKEIAITDHSDICNTYYKRQKLSSRGAIKRWKNVHNDVKVTFGVEADIINKEGDIDTKNGGMDAEFIVLSAHLEGYQDDHETITEAYCNAIEKHHKRIAVLGHLDAYYFAKHVDAKKVIEIANKYNIILELNAKNLLIKRNVTSITHEIAKMADKVMVNSDAHCLADFQAREYAFHWLKEHKYI